MLRSPVSATAAGRHDEDQRPKSKRIVDKLASFQLSLDHTLKEGTNCSRRRVNDLPETFTCLELSLAKTNSQMTTLRRLVYKHFAAIETACDASSNRSLF